jgi:hypothetical protein
MADSRQLVENRMKILGKKIFINNHTEEINTVCFYYILIIII